MVNGEVPFIFSCNNFTSALANLCDSTALTLFSALFKFRLYSASQLTGYVLTNSLRKEIYFKFCVKFEAFSRWQLSQGVRLCKNITIKQKVSASKWFQRQFRYTENVFEIFLVYIKWQSFKFQSLRYVCHKVCWY